MKKLLIILTLCAVFFQAKAQHHFHNDQDFRGKATGQAAVNDSGFVTLGQFKDTLNGKVLVDTTVDAVDLSDLLIDDVNASDTTTFSSNKINTISTGGSNLLSIVYGDTTLTTAMHTVVYVGDSAATFTLPDPTTCPNQIFIIRNRAGTGTGTSVSANYNIYEDYNTWTDTTQFAYGQTEIIQSDGERWWNIGAF